MLTVINSDGRDLNFNSYSPMLVGVNWRVLRIGLLATVLIFIDVSFF